MKLKGLVCLICCLIYYPLLADSLAVQKSPVQLIMDENFEPVAYAETSKSHSKTLAFIEKTQSSEKGAVVKSEDLIYLKNGDRVHVSKLQLKNNECVASSSRLGEIKLKQGDIQYIETASSYYFKLSNSIRAEGKLVYDGSKLWIVLSEDSHNIPVDNFAFIELIQEDKVAEEAFGIVSKTRVGGNIAKKYGNAKNLSTQAKIENEIDFLEHGKQLYRIENRAHYSFQQDPTKSSEDGRSFDREGLLDIKLKKRLCPKIFAFIGEEAGFNSSKAIVFSSLLKLGVSHPFIEEELYFLEFGLGISRRDTVYENSPHKGQFDLLSSLDAKYKIDNTLSIKASLSYLPSTKNLSDYNARSLLGFVFDLASPYLVELTLQVDYDSTPEIGKKKSDTSTALNFFYEF